MAITQISRIQHRRGLQQDLPQLASAEIGWSIDTRRLYIGNGDLNEGAPTLGVTEILTEHSINEIQDLINTVNNVMYANVATGSAGSLLGIRSNTGVIDYSLIQNGNNRIGTIKFARNGSSIAFTDSNIQPVTTNLIFTMTANSTHANLAYSTVNAANISFKLSTITSL